MSVLLRTFGTLANRWWSGGSMRLDVERTVQPVAIVDDATSLALPPMNIKVNYGQASGNIPVVGENTIICVVPRTHAVRMLAIRATCVGRIRWGVSPLPLPVFNAGAGPSFEQVTVYQQPDASLAVIRSDVLGFTAVIPGGFLGDDSAGGLLNDVLEQLDCYVLPGQFFWAHDETTNQGATFRVLRFEEIPTTIDQFATSSPKGLSPGV